MLKNLKKNKGITLIALVITVIILLILAGVAISALTGANGLLSQALGAGKTYNEAAKNEVDTLQGLLNELNNYDSGGNTPTPPNMSLTPGTKVEVNQTFDGLTAGTYANPIIPKGFAPINENGANWGKDKDGNYTGYLEGLVIEDKTSDVVTNGSQFVWVPVIVPEGQTLEDIFARKDGYSNGSLQTYVSGGTAKEANPTQTTPTLNDPTQTEVTEMYASVKKNGGFYIARYESGINPSMTKPISITIANADGNKKPVSKAGIDVWNYIPWGGTSVVEASDGYAGNDKANGAVKVARSMYPNTGKLTEMGLPSTAINETGVISTLIYGVQWDSVMKFMENVDNPNVAGKKYVQDSTGMGNYSDSDSTNNPAKTGTNDYRVKNIYDMAGNVYEWTMEGQGTTSRVGRGGNYIDDGSYDLASSRGHRTTDGNGRRSGFSSVTLPIILVLKPYTSLSKIKNPIKKAGVFI